MYGPLSSVCRSTRSSVQEKTSWQWSPSPSSGRYSHHGSEVTSWTPAKVWIQASKGRSVWLILIQQMLASVFYVCTGLTVACWVRWSVWPIPNLSGSIPNPRCDQIKVSGADDEAHLTLVPSCLLPTMFAVVMQYGVRVSRNLVTLSSYSRDFAFVTSFKIDLAGSAPVPNVNIDSVWEGSFNIDLVLIVSVNVDLVLVIRSDIDLVLVISFYINLARAAASNFSINLSGKAVPNFSLD